jgi:hypothetical protein
VSTCLPSSRVESRIRPDAGALPRQDEPMDDGAIDREAMGKMAKALVFIKGADDPTAIALKLASDTGKPADIKKARALFIKLKPSERKGAMAMISDD